MDGRPAMAIRYASLRQSDEHYGMMGTATFSFDYCRGRTVQKLIPSRGR